MVIVYSYKGGRYRDGGHVRGQFYILMYGKVSPALSTTRGVFEGHLLIALEMVLFWCTFMGLKWRCTSMIDESSHELGREELQFRASVSRNDKVARANINARMILDDRYRHTLSVYRDRSCRGVRLEAKAYDGSLRRCPIWTAFSKAPIS